MLMLIFFRFIIKLLVMLFSSMFSFSWWKGASKLFLTSISSGGGSLGMKIKEVILNNYKLSGKNGSNGITAHTLSDNV